MRTLVMFTAALAALAYATHPGVIGYTHDLQLSASGVPAPNPYQVVLVVLPNHQHQPSHPQHPLPPPHGLTYSTSAPYATLPRTRAPTNDWHTFVFGSPHAAGQPLHVTREALPAGGNSLDSVFAVSVRPDFDLLAEQPQTPPGPSHLLTTSGPYHQQLHPPRPTFPEHLRTIQNQHPQGENYWMGLQGDSEDCPVIRSCPARYGCHMHRKPGTRCHYCKCDPRPPHNSHK